MSAASPWKRPWRIFSNCPSRGDLERRFPSVVWRGYRFGEDLASHFASADCFVFPSRTETFGNVLLEAMASGLPVAAVPAPGPVDLVTEGVNGAIDDQLMRACLRAIRCSRERTRASILQRTLRGGHDVFRAHLVPTRPDGAARFSPPAVQDDHLPGAAAAL
jgi:glycosyltransferase involved in cell wall biosynthesis